jgi:hypothetical protein
MSIDREYWCLYYIHINITIIRTMRSLLFGLICVIVHCIAIILCDFASLCVHFIAAGVSTACSVFNIVFLSTGIRSHESRARGLCCMLYYSTKLQDVDPP